MPKAVIPISKSNRVIIQAQFHEEFCLFFSNENGRNSFMINYQKAILTALYPGNESSMQSAVFAASIEIR
ncbi:hypothetical protein ACQCVP_13030 [Rossellomorea vietnamensis]|uniref:hypothetical protein n=1 Tax=Rossellomorea vietnamensis TaxID=218284 RepID=UPI003CF21BC4